MRRTHIPVLVWARVRATEYPFPLCFLLPLHVVLSYAYMPCLCAVAERRLHLRPPDSDSDSGLGCELELLPPSASLVTAVRPTSNVLYCCAHTHSSPCCSLLIVSSSVRQKYARYNWNVQPADRPRDARGREGGCDGALQHARGRGACSGKRRMSRCGAPRATAGLWSATGVVPRCAVRDAPVRGTAPLDSPVREEMRILAR